MTSDGTGFSAPSKLGYLIVVPMLAFAYSVIPWPYGGGLFVAGYLIAVFALAYTRARTSIRRTWVAMSASLALAIVVTDCGLGFPIGGTLVHRVYPRSPDTTVADRAAAADRHGLAYDPFFGAAGHGFDRTVERLGALSSGALVATGSYSSYDDHRVRGAVVVENGDARAIPIEGHFLDLLAEEDGGLLFLTDHGVSRVAPEGYVDRAFADGVAHALAAGVTSFGAIARRADGGFVVGGEIADPMFPIALGVFDAHGALDQPLTVRLTAALRSITAPVEDDTLPFFAAIAGRPDGSIVVRGFHAGASPLGGRCALRFDARGNLDPSYRPTPPEGLVCDAAVRGADGFAITADGSILVVATPWRDRGVTAAHRLLRFRPDGTLDAEFVAHAAHALAYPTESRIASVVIDPLGRVIVGGFFSSGDRTDCVLRLEADGSLDERFRRSARIWTCEGDVQTVALAPDGDVAIGGNFVLRRGRERKLHLARLASNGFVQ